MQASEIKMLLNLPLIILVLTIKILHNVKTQIMLMLFLEQARRQWCSQPENFFEPIILTFSKQQYFVWDNTSQSAKQEMLENWWPCLLATPMPVDNLLGPCRRPSARGHHIGDP